MLNTNIPFTVLQFACAPTETLIKHNDNVVFTRRNTQGNWSLVSIPLYFLYQRFLVKATLKVSEVEYKVWWHSGIFIFINMIKRMKYFNNKKMLLTYVSDGVILCSQW